VVTVSYEDRSDTLRRNETLSQLFARHGIAGPQLSGLLDAASGLRPRKVPAGQVFEFRYAAGEQLPRRVKTRVGDEAILKLYREDDGSWRGEREAITWTLEKVRISGAVSSSLYRTLLALIPDTLLSAGQKAALVWDLSDGVFAWEIDFATELRKGDEFRILFERLQSSEGDVRYGRVLAAILEARGRRHAAYVMTDERGRNVYYDAEGKSLRRAFLRSPVRYRITSRFSNSRFHPILQQYRPHLGTDYRAPYGTPVEATGAGTVIQAGRWGGYGLMVAIRHPKNIETRYAHLSRLAPGIRAGVRVEQGQVIGYSGSSGLATAPHVHYEFLKNGRQINPRAEDLGDGTPVPEARRAEFESLKAYYDRWLSGDGAQIVAIESR
jgi:murein DD-endopeptidase MepM/ murein hydrolase activator NlpD